MAFDQHCAFLVGQRLHFQPAQSVRVVCKDRASANDPDNLVAVRIAGLAHEGDPREITGKPDSAGEHHVAVRSGITKPGCGFDGVVHVSPVPQAEGH